MSILMDRITLLCIAKGTTIYKIEKLAELSQGSMRNWAEATPSGDKIMRVANYFDVSMDYLMGNSDNPQSHKNEGEQVPFASEISQAIVELEACVEQAAKQTAAQTEARIHRIKSLLQVNGIEVHPNKSNDIE